ncbi:hypothetical protein KR222_007238 [Zaprionus bogoriensis]|nr:hypothetical protein KR222_007238 [Zaprionus bogoriensis]
MSGKLIMKRKRADQLRTQQAEEQQRPADDEPVAEKRPCLEQQPRLITPPSEEQPAVGLNRLHTAHAPNSILLEALQKIMELQSELDSFEQDLDDYEASGLLDVEEDAHLDAEVAANFAPPRRRSDAEALGFAMCARETLLFLQNEGVSPESVLYKTLLGKLVGQSDGLLQV